MKAQPGLRRNKSTCSSICLPSERKQKLLHQICWKVPAIQVVANSTCPEPSFSSGAGSCADSALFTFRCCSMQQAWWMLCATPVSIFSVYATAGRKMVHNSHNFRVFFLVMFLLILFLLQMPQTFYGASFLQAGALFSWQQDLPNPQAVFLSLDLHKFAQIHQYRASHLLALLLLSGRNNINVQNRAAKPA